MGTREHREGFQKGRVRPESTENKHKQGVRKKRVRTYELGKPGKRSAKENKKDPSMGGDTPNGQEPGHGKRPKKLGLGKAKR